MERSQYDWIMEQEVLYIHSYRFEEETIGSYMVTAHEHEKKKGEEEKESLIMRWRGHENFRYIGILEIKENFIYLNSTRDDKSDKVFSIFPVPKLKKVNTLWGMALSVYKGFPVSNVLLATGNEISKKSIQQEFQTMGFNKENFEFALKYDFEQKNKEIIDIDDDDLDPKPTKIFDFKKFNKDKEN